MRKVCIAVMVIFLILLGSYGESFAEIKWKPSHFKGIYKCYGSGTWDRQQYVWIGGIVSDGRGAVGLIHKFKYDGVDDLGDPQEIYGTYEIDSVGVIDLFWNGAVEMKGIPVQGGKGVLLSVGIDPYFFAAHCWRDK